MPGSNLDKVRARIREAAKRAGRNPDEVILVCVTKGIDAEKIKEIINLGVLDIGENRVQEARKKYSLLTQIANRTPLTEIHWHLIGHLQSNKARDAARLFNLIHSIDSLGLAQVINRGAAKIGKTQEILIEVNTSGESTKFGIKPENTITLVQEILKLTNVKLMGLMTIAPIVDNPEKARPYFRMIRELRNKIYDLRVTDYELPVLSMGMSQDFEIAIEEGATMVRIGTAIFNPLTTHR